MSIRAEWLTYEQMAAKCNQRVCQFIQNAVTAKFPLKCRTLDFFYVSDGDLAAACQAYFSWIHGAE